MFSGGARGKGGDEVIVVQGNQAAVVWRLLAGGCPQGRQGRAALELGAATPWHPLCSCAVLTLPLRQGGMPPRRSYY